jgi:hypothetical protein
VRGAPHDLARWLSGRGGLQPMEVSGPPDEVTRAAAAGWRI